MLTFTAQITNLPISHFNLPIDLFTHSISAQITYEVGKISQKKLATSRRYYTFSYLIISQ